jgi:hypothetical protein
MKKNDSNPKRKGKKINFINRHKFVFIGLLLLISIYVTFIAYNTQVSTNTETNKNPVVVTNSYDCKTEVKPGVLYPKGGLISSDNAILVAIAKNIQIHYEMSYSSSLPVIFEGSQGFTLHIVGGDMWDKAMPLNTLKNFKSESNNGKVISEDLIINVDMIKKYITDMGNEIGTNPDTYTIKIVPNIKSALTYNGKNVQVQAPPVISFDYNYQQIKLSGNKTSSITVNMSDNKLVYNSVNVLGIMIPVMAARTIFSLITLVLVILSLGRFKKVKTNKKSALSEVERIDKRLNNRIIKIRSPFDFQDKITIAVESFKSLEQLSDDKEQPILKLQKKDISTYYLIDGICIYFYHAWNTNSAEISIGNIPIGSELNSGQ